MRHGQLAIVSIVVALGWAGTTGVLAATQDDVVVRADRSTPTPSPASTTPDTDARTAPGDGRPADVLDLTDWKITLPTGDTDDADEVEQPDLATFVSDDFFHVTPDADGVVFRAPAGGSTTSGSDYPRSELREMTAGGSQEASWSNRSGRHVMTVRQAITATPEGKDEVVAGQIHDSEDDVVMIRLEGDHLFVEADGDEAGTLDDSYVLGTPFTVRITATPAGIAVRYDDGPEVVVDEVGDGYYFKAGCYTQSNTDHDDASAYGEVVVHDLSVEHQD